MSRLKNFSRNLATGYLQLGVNVIYSLVSIPLILYWLPRDQFGMWSVLIQLMGYVSMIDFGMTAAVTRLLIDHKDERANGNYGSLLKTAVFVSLAQGLLILAVVTIAAPLFTHLMRIPAEYRAVFTVLLRVQGAITALTFALRPLSLALDAHQRVDVVAWFGIFNLIGQLGLLIVFLSKGVGIYSFLYAGVISAVISPLYLFWNCRRLGVLPKRGEWGRASWRKFREIFAFGADVFLFSLGGQLILSSQTIIITRCFGLDLAAIWSVGTKIFNLCLQLVFRPLFTSMPALAEMIVRNERSRLRLRFDGLAVLTASLGVYVGVSYALCNSLFVRIWTHDRIIWPALNDTLLATWIFILALQAVHCNFCMVAKQIGGLRYVLFAEGCFFVVAAAVLGARAGIPGIIAVSIMCTTFFSFQYCLRRSLKYFQTRPRNAVEYWILPSLRLFLVYGLTALVTWTVTNPLPPLARLCAHGAVAGILGPILLLRMGLPSRMVHEFSEKMPKSAGKWLLLFTSSTKSISTLRC